MVISSSSLGATEGRAQVYPPALVKAIVSGVRKRTEGRSEYKSKLCCGLMLQPRNREHESAWHRPAAFSVTREGRTRWLASRSTIAATSALTAAYCGMRSHPSVRSHVSSAMYRTATQLLFLVGRTVRCWGPDPRAKVAPTATYSGPKDIRAVHHRQ